MNVIEICSGGDISNASSHTRVVDPEMLNVAHLVVAQPLPNLVVLSGSSKLVGFHRRLCGAMCL